MDELEIPPGPEIKRALQFARQGFDEDIRNRNDLLQYVKIKMTETTDRIDNDSVGT